MKIGGENRMVFFSLHLNKVDIFWEGQIKQKLPILFDVINSKLKNSFHTFWGLLRFNDL